MSASYAYDVNAENFEQIVVQGSYATPVLVDFWATWCGPCKVLKPVLEKLAESYAGKFVLAKLETDANQALASQFGIRGVPTVKAFVNGNIVDEFSGALPEPQVRQFIDKLIPSPSETMRLEAARLSKAGDPTGALKLLTEAAQLDSKNEAVKVDMASLLFEAGSTEDAQQLLSKLSPEISRQSTTQALLARIDFALKAKDLPDASDLQQRLLANPDDLDARMQSANLAIASQDYEAALAQLIAIVQRDRHFQDDAARKAMLSVFALMGGNGEIVTRYRRLLASALN